MQKEYSDITHPHDKLFKQVFSDVSNATDFIQGIFPKQLLGKLDLKSLALETGTYVNKHLKEAFSDLVYSVNYRGKEQIQISLLFEHKSYPEKYPHIQLLEYQLNVFKTQIKQKQELTPIIPIIVYHGKRKWEQKAFTEDFKYMDEELEKYLPKFEYMLCDFSKLETEAIIGELFTKEKIKIAVALMKLIFNRKILEELLEPILRIGENKYEGADGKAFLETIISYLYFAGDIEPEVIIETVAKISEEGGKTAMTAAAKLMERGVQQGIQQGIQQGVQQGMQQGRQETLRETYAKLIKSGMTAEAAKKLLEL